MILLIILIFFGSNLQATIAQSSGILPIQNSSSLSPLTLSNRSSTANVSNNIVNSTSTTMSPTEVKIGALLPLTGALASGGQTEKASTRYRN